MWAGLAFRKPSIVNSDPQSEAQQITSFLHKLPSSKIRKTQMNCWFHFADLPHFSEQQTRTFLSSGGWNFISHVDYLYPWTRNLNLVWYIKKYIHICAHIFKTCFGCTELRLDCSYSSSHCTLLPRMLLEWRVVYFKEIRKIFPQKNVMFHILSSSASFTSIIHTCVTQT